MDSSAPTSIFLRLLGPQAEALPACVRRLHAAKRPAEFRGRAVAGAARSRLARLCAWVAGLPRADGEIDVRVVLTSPAPGVEVWTRKFGRSTFRSTLRAVGDELHEQLGPVRIRFRLHGDAAGIVWVPLGIDVLRLPLPLALLSGVRARESERDGRYRFDVAASLPLIGLIVRYDGWLDV
ncbi:MAG: DUF4166 domain-containing protein [Rhodanobacteraceae bacterium]|nr:DUF4166 domain-containing protein [Rhodanobacteraceae bacterium]MBP9155129.1 DUF4166 domain-containing protein [Xanthomonadales bacterium]